MNTQAKISLFKNYREVKPAGEISVFQFYENIVNSDYQKEITELRAINEKSLRDAIKATLPACTISGTFSQRNSQSLIQHSGFICIDIDGKDNPTITNWQGLRDTLGTWEEVVCAALSVSGRGLFLIIAIAYPWKHREQFLALEKDFRNIGLVIDKQCKDVARLRVVTSDPQATWNENAKPYRKVIKEKPATAYKGKTSPELGKLIEWTERKHGSFTRGNRNNYVTQLASAAHRFGISKSEVKAYCRGLVQSDFLESAIIRTINSIYANPVWTGKAIVNN